MSDTARRKLLKSIAAGSGAIVAGKNLPESWSRPVVDSVILPAHAQTSATIFSDTGIPGVGVPIAQLNRETQLAGLLDSLVPEANAGQEPNANGWYACAMISGSSVSVSVAGLGGGRGVAGPTETTSMRRGTLDIGGAVGAVTASGSDYSSCIPDSPERRTRPARIESVSNTEIVLQILTGCGENGCTYPLLQLTILRNDGGCLPEPAVSNAC